jgi:GDP-L-fucose synthase
MKQMDRDAKIYVAGHGGMVGSAIVRKLRDEGCRRLVLRTAAELDLRRQQAVDRFFEEERPQYVFLAAARVGGILANDTERGAFLYDNLMIEANVIHAAYRHGAAKLLFLGSSCIYPRCAAQPMREDCLLTGALEPTNEPYAVAKIAGLKLCDAYRSQYGCNFISAMPTNLYGPNDNYNLRRSHVLPALLRKTIEATRAGRPQVEVWGSGDARREFLHVDDLADACLFLMRTFDGPGWVNVGTGEDVSIRELAALIGQVAGYRGELVFDPSRPDGAPRKLLDVGKLREMGWRPKISLEEGVRRVHAAVRASPFLDRPSSRSAR